MGEAYLDWQSKSGGIKLNDVIEEYRYVANGKTVKSGDLLAYVEETAGTTLKTGNIFPTTGWTAVTAPTKYSANGYTIEASSCGTNYYAYKASDNAPAQPWLSTGNVAQGWVKMTCPKPTKITKMKTYITATNKNSFKKGVIQGSKDNSNWVDLYTLSAVQTEMLTEVVLSNADYYTHYQIVIDLDSTGLNINAQIGDWETSEYETVGTEIRVTPAIEPPFNAIALSSGVGGTDTEHNEQVKIARLPQLVQGNMFPTSWTYVSDTGYIADDGTRLITSSYRSGGTLPYEANLGCDGDTTTYWLHALDDLTPTFTLVLPTAIKVLKMNVCITFGYTGNLEKCRIVGSNDGVVWNPLYNIEAGMPTLTEIVLENPDFYKMYRVEASYSEILNMAVCELQTSEYITKEVIQ